VPQLVLTGAFRQAPLPSQVPLAPQGRLAFGAHPPWGSEAPGATGWHEPACPLTLQALQVPQLAVEQHTPSTQLALWHWFPAVQLCPRRRRPHEPLLQTFPGAQSLSAAQTAMQVVPLQANGEQLWVVAVLQIPAPSQLRASEAVVVPVGQLGARHCVPAA
jgi:hypothetical protein